MSRLDIVMGTNRSLCHVFEKESTTCRGCHWIDAEYYCRAPRLFELNQQELRALGDTLYV